MKTLLQFSLVFIFSINILLAQESNELSIVQPEIENLIGVSISISEHDHNLEHIQPTLNDKENNGSNNDVSTDEDSENGVSYINDNDRDNEPDIEQEELLIRSKGKGKNSIRVVYNDPKVSMYPNPAINNVNFNLEDDFIRIEVYDLIGNKVYENNIENSTKQSIDLSNFTSGIYMVNLIALNKISSKKLAINK